MKVPKFMRQEKLSFSATKKIDASPFHTPQMTQWKATTTTTTSSTDNKNSLDIIYNLTTTINVPKVAISPNSIIKNMKSNSARFTKSAQPKRLKRNRLVLSGKLKNEKMETPVKAYLKARDSMIIPQKQLFKDEEMNDESSPSLNNQQQQQQESLSSASDIKKLFKSSFSQLTKFVSKSRLSVGTTSNGTTTTTTTTTTKSSPSVSSPKLLFKLKSNINLKNHISNSRRPVMGITALMLEKYKNSNNINQQDQTTSCYMTNVSWPNVYLIGLPIVFNKNDNINVKTGTPRRITSTSCSNMKLELCNEFDNINCIL